MPDHLSSAISHKCPSARGAKNGLAAFLPELAREVGTARYADGVSTVDLNRAAVDGIVELSRASGVATAIHEPLRVLLHQRSADGLGTDSFSSVFELMRQRDVPQQ